MRAPLALKPRFVKPGGRQRFDAADVHEVQQGATRKTAAVDLKHIGMEGQLPQPRQLFQVSVDGISLRQPILRHAKAYGPRMVALRADDRRLGSRTSHLRLRS